MVGLISCVIISQNSNLYDHDTSTSQTDRQRDGRMDGQTNNLPLQSVRFRAVKIAHNICQSNENNENMQLICNLSNYEIFSSQSENTPKKLLLYLCICRALSVINDTVTGLGLCRVM